MNAKSFAFAALFATLSIGAHATEASEGPVSSSVTSREAVRAEVQAAIKNGSFVRTNEGVSLPAQRLVTSLDRATVRQQAIDALRQRPQVRDELHVGG